MFFECQFSNLQELRLANHLVPGVGRIELFEQTDEGVPRDGREGDVDDALATVVQLVHGHDGRTDAPLPDDVAGFPVEGYELAGGAVGEVGHL